VSRDVGLLLLRVGIGGLLAFGHGLGKVEKIFAGNFEFGDPIGIGAAASLVLAAFAEFVCSLAVAAGLWTRWSAVPPVVTMVVAAFVVHAADPWGRKELAVLYLVAFTVLILTGSGRFSVDALWAKTKRKGR
jgi:putative oxidoreductase